MSQNPSNHPQPLDIERLRSELLHLGPVGEPSDLDADLANVNPEFRALFESKDFRDALSRAIRADEESRARQ